MFPSCCGECHPSSDSEHRRLFVGGEWERDDKLQVTYIVNLTKQCCDHHSSSDIIHVMSEVKFFDDDNDAAILMMHKTIAAIKSHTKEQRYGGIDTCGLDYECSMGSYYMMGKKDPFHVAPLVGIGRK